MVRQTLHQIPAWVQLRRWQREGFARAWRRWRCWRQVLHSSPVVTDRPEPGQLMEIHLLCCQHDYLSAIWALKSFYRFAQKKYPLIIHLQSNLFPASFRRLAAHFPSAMIVSKAQADSAVGPRLGQLGFERLGKLRSENPMMLKLIDFKLLSRSSSILSLDSDVIFFRQPAELLVNGERTPSHSLFQRDRENNYNLTLEEALSELNICLWPRINAGLILYPAENLDLRRCEELLQNAKVARSTGLVEQTLHALCASELGKVEYLPPTYLISLEPCPDLASLVARHYAGPSRPLLTSEGIPYLWQNGFLEC